MIEGREAIDAAVRKGSIFESHGIAGFDWTYGRILLREAEALANRRKLLGNEHP